MSSRRVRVPAAALLAVGLFAVVPVAAAPVAASKTVPGVAPVAAPAAAPTVTAAAPSTAAVTAPTPEAPSILPAVAAALAANKAPPAWLRKDTKAAAPALATQTGPSPLRVGGMLALVATLGGIAYYARRRNQLQPAKLLKQDLRVLGSTRIGPKATAVVVEIHGKRILLGVTEQSVNNLAWLDDEPSQAADDREVSSLRSAPTVSASIPPEAAGPSGFLKLLRNAVGANARQVIPSDEVARATRDEVHLSHRERAPRESARRERETTRERDEEILEGQVMGLVKRRKESS